MQCTVARGRSVKKAVLSGQILKGIEILVVAVDAVQGPQKALPFFYKKIVQMGFVKAEVPQVNDAGDCMAEHVFGIGNLLVDGAVVAMGIAGYQNH